MGSLLRSVKKRKKSRRLGEVEIVSREEYAEFELDAKVEMIRSLGPAGANARSRVARRRSESVGRGAIRSQGRVGAWPGAELPTRAQIDDATPENPIFVQRLDAHMGLANSLALAEAGIERSTKDPPGGSIVKDPATGEPTGVLKDAAMELVHRVIPAPDAAAPLRAARAALAEAARLGVTTVHDISSFEDLRTYQTLSRDKELTARIYAITPLPEWRSWRQRESRLLSATTGSRSGRSKDSLTARSPPGPPECPTP